MRRLFFIFCLILALLSPAAVTAEEMPPDPSTVDVPVLMYHSLNHRGRHRWMIPASDFEKDLKFLSENGYSSVFISDLVAFVYENVPLPEKPVVITFDDGCYNNLTLALPLLEKYDMRIVLSIIGEAADMWTDTADKPNDDYAHLSWPQIAEMYKTGRVELSNHTQSLHKNNHGRNGCVRKKGEGLEEYRHMFTKDVMTLQESFQKHCGVTPICFAYPFGSKCHDALDALKAMGFKATLSCSSGMNRIVAGDPDCLYDLRRVNRDPGKSAQRIIEGMK